MTSQVLEQLVDANHILSQHGIFDAFGHVSARHPLRADRFFLSRNLAPELVTLADLLEHDLEGDTVCGRPARALYAERFIHAEIYRARPDVQAVVHSHSTSLLPFSLVGSARLRPVCHMSGFLGSGAPCFEIRDVAGSGTDLLIRTRALAASLVEVLSHHAVVLMRGHGSTTVASSIKLAVYRAIYAEVNAGIQLSAQALGEVTFLSKEEATATALTNEGQVERPWRLWTSRLGRHTHTEGAV